MKAKELPSAEYLNECFFYDHISGILVWKTRPLSHFEDEWRMNQSNSRMSGKSPTVKSDGYVVLKISGVTYKSSSFNLENGIWRRCGTNRPC